MLACLVISDLVLFLSILLFDKIIFKFNVKRDSLNKIKLMVVFACVIGISLAINIKKNLVFGSLIYIALVCVITYIIFDENFKTLLLSSFWTIGIIEMLDKMSVIIIDVIYEITGISNIGVAKISRATIIFLFVAVVGLLYNRKYSEGIKTIDKGSLVTFTVLTIVDTVIVMVIANIIVVDNEPEKQIIYYVAFIFAIFGLYIQLGAVILALMQRNIYKESQQLTEKYLEEQKSHYEYLEKREIETKRFRHDLRSHMEMLSVLAKERRYDEFDKYVEEINVNIDRFGNNVTVQNGIVDAIINKYYSEAIVNNVNMEVKGRFPSDCKIDAYDLCTIFSNILSNALEAAVEAKEKWISVECRYTDDNILVEVKNTFDNKNTARNGKMRTHKKDANNHGFGLENVKDSIRKYNGLWSIDIEQNIYKITIAFNYVRQE